MQPTPTFPQMPFPVPGQFVQMVPPPFHVQSRPFTFILPINPECVGLVIGTKGRTIKMISSSTGSHIRLKQPEPEKDRHLPYFVISGTPVSVTRAAVKITEIAEESKHRNRSSGNAVPVPVQVPAQAYVHQEHDYPGLPVVGGHANYPVPQDTEHTQDGSDAAST